MSLADLGALTALGLAFGGLPTTHERLAQRLLAIPLIPTLRPERLPASLTQADAAAKPMPTRRTRRADGMLTMSQGRSCSRRGRPSDSLKSLGHFFSGFDEPRAGAVPSPSF